VGQPTRFEVIIRPFLRFSDISHFIKMQKYEILEPSEDPTCGARSDQKTLKVGMHSFPALRSAFKRVSVKVGPQVRLLCP